MTLSLLNSNSFKNGIHPPENKDVTFEALCNALVRRTVFVTGAVNMDGCPEADRGEVAFIGRSNVGKSSLVNMVRWCYCSCFMLFVYLFHDTDLFY